LGVLSQEFDRDWLDTLEDDALSNILAALSKHYIRGVNAGAAQMRAAFNQPNAQNGRKSRRKGRRRK